jgi:RNA polymerase sigma-70 factor, ECF subfamily
MGVTAMGPPGPDEASPRSEGERLRLLVRHHFEPVGRLLRALGVREAEVDDAAQQTFVILARRIAELPPGAERMFVYRTALYVAAHARRALARSREVLQDDAAWISDRPSPDELIDQRRARECLDSILETMPVELRTVLVLFEIDEMPIADIAALLNLPVGTAASRLRRAREDFEQRVLRWRARTRRMVGT